MHHVLTTGFAFERVLDRFDLAANTTRTTSFNLSRMMLAITAS
jgi:hypothetical protein